MLYIVLETSHFLIPELLKAMISRTVFQNQKGKKYVFDPSNFSKYHQYLERCAESQRSPIFPKH